MKKVTDDWLGFDPVNTDVPSPVPLAPPPEPPKTLSAPPDRSSAQVNADKERRNRGRGGFMGAIKSKRSSLDVEQGGSKSKKKLFGA